MIKRDITIEKTDTGFTGVFEAMASPCEVLIETCDYEFALKLTKIAAKEAWRIEHKLSRYRNDNILYQIHHARGELVEVDDELTLLLNFADQCYQLTEGMFDITSGVLRRAWKFDCSDNVPSQQQIDTLLPLIGWGKVYWQQPFIALPQDMELDLGGIGKEYAVDRAALLITQCTDVPVLINFGGDLYATKPPSTRESWQIGVESIGGLDKAGVIQLKSGGVATSGDARRYLVCDGIRYSHVLNPKTGWSVENTPNSVTVAMPRCIEAGFLSTAAMLHGQEAGEFLEAQDVLFWIQE